VSIAKTQPAAVNASADQLCVLPEIGSMNDKIIPKKIAFKHEISKL